MLKQISTLIAILFAAIIVITLPAMAETDKPDAATKEQQVEEEKSQSQKKLAKKGRRSHSWRGDIRLKSRRNHGREANYRQGGHRSHHRLGKRMSDNRRFRGRRGLQMMKGGFGRMLPP